MLFPWEGLSFMFCFYPPKQRTWIHPETEVGKGQTLPELTRRPEASIQVVFWGGW